MSNTTVRCIIVMPLTDGYIIARDRGVFTNSYTIQKSAIKSMTSKPDGYVDIVMDELEAQNIPAAYVPPTEEQDV
jgi:hypothetical protein